MSYSWTCSDRILSRQELPLLMGILNVTPDSFSDGGHYQTVDAAVAQGLQLVEDGAQIIDIGGESTRPGAAPVSADEELQRTIPVVRQLAARTTVPISIDTTKSLVARQAIDAGASIVNDISGLTFDHEMLTVCRNSDVGICLMHIQGTPQTMQQQPTYNNVVDEVCEFLQQQLMRCLESGIAIERLCVDPGIGFGKTADHNLQLMLSTELIHQRLQRPVLIGHSRKSFLKRILGRPVEDRVAGTIGVSIALAQQGVDLLRVHDVRLVRDALIAWHTVRPTACSIAASGDSVPVHL